MLCHDFSMVFFRTGETLQYYIKKSEKIIFQTVQYMLLFFLIFVIWSIANDKNAAMLPVLFVGGATVEWIRKK